MDWQALKGDLVMARLFRAGLFVRNPQCALQVALQHCAEIDIEWLADCRSIRRSEVADETLIRVGERDHRLFTSLHGSNSPLSRSIRLDGKEHLRHDIVHDG